MSMFCPECGTAWRDDQTCQDYFHQMLFWENENPVNGEVHHLMVLGYHLQHPSLYSPAGLIEGQRLLREFVERGVSPAEMVRRNRARVDSGKRTWKIKGTPAAHGAYAQPVAWTMTAAAVIAGGELRYREKVRAWARAALDSLNALIEPSAR